MKRRNFVKLLGMGIPGVATGKNMLAGQMMNNQFMYQYPVISGLNDVITKENEILVRIKFASRDPQLPAINKGQIKVEHAELAGISHHNLEMSNDSFIGRNNSYTLRSAKNRPDVLMLRLKNGAEKTRIILDNHDENLAFQLGEILEKGYLQFSRGNTIIDVNFLLDKEIGSIEPSKVGIKGDPDNFSFHILADPQGGDPEQPFNHPTRMRIHNAFLEDTIRLANKMPERPLFSMILGDVVDSQGEKENFQTMHRYLSRLKSPVLYELGNHESRYSATFEPGYKMDALNNYFSAQKKMNGLDKLLYSFNIGQWHFVVWPDPLRSFFWDNHPHYFEWLKKDLEKHKNRPTIVFQHVPVHPIGISPFMSYLESPAIRKKVMEIVTGYGNVRYVISGHTHTTAKASLKTAFSIRGTNFINLPAAGYRPRGFGEQDHYGGPSQGIGIVSIRGKEAEVLYKTVLEEEVKYPENLPKLDLDKYKLWFNEKWEVMANNNLMNGSFNKGLEHWIPSFVYSEDKDPSNICEAGKVEGKSSLYLYNRKRGYEAPGQDRLPQNINRVTQVVKNNPDKSPVLRFRYRVDNNHFDPEGFCGGYVWIEGYDRSFRQFNLVYSAGKAYANPAGRGRDNAFPVHHYHLPARSDWTDVVLHLKDDFNRAEKERKYEDLNIDRLVINLGVWHMNEGGDQPFGIYFTDFDLKSTRRDVTAFSAIEGTRIKQKDDQQVWWLGRHIPFIHLAGEHRYHLATTGKTLFRKES
jgi:3',5'-cyclic AMP phosphodiesterase CpdA